MVVVATTVEVIVIARTVKVIELVAEAVTEAALAVTFI